MSKFQEIFQSFRPLLGWRSRRVRDGEPLREGATQLSQAPVKTESKRSLVLPRGRPREKIEWVPVPDPKDVKPSFQHFRSSVYELTQKPKREPGQTSPFLWESGTLAGSRPYFYLQPWSERGWLVEESPKGWVISRAEKIASQSQFIRDRLAWDHVMLYQAENSPGMLKVSSTLMGESLVSLALYEDFMVRMLRGESEA